MDGNFGGDLSYSAGQFYSGFVMNQKARPYSDGNLLY